MITGAVESAVAALRAAVDGLLDAPVETLEAAGLVRVIEAVEVQRRRLEAVDQRLLGAASMAGVASVCGQPGLAGVLAALLRIDVPEARRRVARAGDLGPRRAVTGEALAPILPAAAAAVADGELSAAQADVVIGCLEKIPPSAPPVAWEVAERLLVEAARFEAPGALRRTANELLTRLDQDGLEPVEDQAQRLRGFTLVPRPDGTQLPRGVWTAELAACWQPILDSLAAPRPAEDGIPDPRSAAQRRHDAMLEAARRLLDSGSLPVAGGVPVTVLATTTIRELTAAAHAAALADFTTADAAHAAAGSDLSKPETGPAFTLAELAAAAGYGELELGGVGAAGLARLGHGEQVSIRTLLTLAGDAQIIPVIFNDTGGILAYGRGQRLADRGQRLALAARDGGCCFPDCDRPAAWAEVHHIIAWAAGGSTDLDNMCLLCAFHHRHFETAGWTVHMADDGLPEWLPPAWLDPEQTPRRNTTHHRPDIHFRQPTTAA